jgi:5-formyltetrahydrofolate cyclo-ligase
MEFYRMDHLEDLEPSRFGVPEPDPVASRRYHKLDKSEKIDAPLMLLPGLAFDPYGNRIGYGAGYYDKFLSKYPRDYFYKLGICYDFQVVERIDAEEYDICADAILTPSRRLQCQ